MYVFGWCFALLLRKISGSDWNWDKHEWVCSRVGESSQFMAIWMSENDPNLRQTGHWTYFIDIFGWHGHRVPTWRVLFLLVCLKYCYLLIFNIAMEAVWRSYWWRNVFGDVPKSPNSMLSIGKKKHLEMGGKNQLPCFMTCRKQAIDLL